MWVKPLQTKDSLFICDMKKGLNNKSHCVLMMLPDRKPTKDMFQLYNLQHWVAILSLLGPRNKHFMVRLDSYITV